jgi:hypothetical protein
MRITIAFVWLVTLSQPSLAVEVPRIAQDAIARAIGCFPDTWNRRDMTAFGQCFTVDADFVNV